MSDYTPIPRLHWNCSCGAWGDVAGSLVPFGIIDGTLRKHVERGHKFEVWERGDRKNSTVFELQDSK